MCIEISDKLARIEASQYTIFTQKLHSSLRKTLKKFHATIHQMDNNNYWLSFNSINDAVQCALEAEHKFKYVTPKNLAFKKRLHMGLDWSAEQTHPSFLLVKTMCDWVNHPFVISIAVKQHYETLNHHAEIDLNHIKTLTEADSSFLLRLTGFLSEHFNRPSLDVQMLGSALGLNYPKIYRSIKRLTGHSPSAFIKAFRLQKALENIHNHKGSISQIAKKTGFNSATYFSDCFLKTYGIRPLKYQQQHS